jgi:hypothetical protein
MPLAVLSPEELAAYEDIRDRLRFHAARLPDASSVGLSFTRMAESLDGRIPSAVRSRAASPRDAARRRAA